MEAMSYTQARSKFASLMDNVCKNHDTVIITRQKQPSVVMMSLEDYNSLEETAYLLRSPKNAKSLIKALEESAQGLGKEIDLEKEYQEMANDEEAEQEAYEWIEGLTPDAFNWKNVKKQHK